MWHCLLDLSSGHVFSGREVLTTASALTLPFKFVKMFLVLALRGYASNKENFNANNLYPWRSIQPIQLVLLLYSGYKKYPDTTMLYDVLTSCPKDIKLTACKERSFSSGFFYWASGEFYS